MTENQTLLPDAEISKIADYIWQKIQRGESGVSRSMIARQIKDALADTPTSRPIKREEGDTAFIDGHGNAVMHSDLYDECHTCQAKEEDLNILRELLREAELCQPDNSIESRIKWSREQAAGVVEALLQRILAANDLHAVFTIKDSAEFKAVMEKYMGVRGEVANKTETSTVTPTTTERDECRQTFESWYEENAARYGLGSFKSCEWVWKAAWNIGGERQ